MCLARVFPSDWEPEMDVLTDKPHRRSLLDHFSAVPDPRQAWRVAHPLPEVLLLVVCGTIAANDDYDDIVDWGEAHLSFLRRFSAFHFGLPCADWLRTLMNRIDPDLFSEGGAGEHRRGRLQSRYCTGRRGWRGRLPLGRQGEPADSA
jgi:DDE family transposase